MAPLLLTVAKLKILINWSKLKISSLVASGPAWGDQPKRAIKLTIAPRV